MKNLINSYVLRSIEFEVLRYKVILVKSLQIFKNLMKKKNTKKITLMILLRILRIFVCFFKRLLMIEFHSLIKIKRLKRLLMIKLMIIYDN